MKNATSADRNRYATHRRNLRIKLAKQIALYAVAIVAVNVAGNLISTKCFPSD